MIHTDNELQATLKRIERFQRQIAHLRSVENDPENFRLSAAGFIAELDRMNLEVREYLWSHPTELQSAGQP